MMIAAIGPRPSLQVMLIKTLLVVVALAQVVDVISTNRALAAGMGLYEANPVMGFSMSALGSFWWLPKFAIAAVLIGSAIQLKRATMREFAMAVLVPTLYLGVLVNNYMGFFG